MTSSTVDVTTLPILRRQGSQAIPIVSVERKFTFDFSVLFKLTDWQAKCSKLAAKDFDTAEFHQHK